MKKKNLFRALLFHKPGSWTEAEDWSNCSRGEWRNCVLIKICWKKFLPQEKDYVGFRRVNLKNEKQHLDIVVSGKGGLWHTSLKPMPGEVRATEPRTQLAWWGPGSVTFSVSIIPRWACWARQAQGSPAHSSAQKKKARPYALKENEPNKIVTEPTRGLS